MSAPLPPHHQAWLDSHPHRTEGWLRRVIADGFDVHHIDGDRANNEPSNLVLVEATDHMAIHTGVWNTKWLRARSQELRAPKEIPSELSQRTRSDEAFDLHAIGMSEVEVANALGLTYSLARSAIRYGRERASRRKRLLADEAVGP